MPFDFEADEVTAILKLVAERVELLSEQPQTLERDEELLTLHSFALKMWPVIQAEKAEVDQAYKSMMN